MSEPITAPGAPGPGTYIVGNVLGVKKITPKSGGKNVHFLRIDDGSDSHDLLIPDDFILDYGKSEPGEVMIVPVRIGLRDYNGTKTLSMVIRAAPGK